jgi:hypothetical protein
VFDHTCGVPSSSPSFHRYGHAVKNICETDYLSDDRYALKDGRIVLAFNPQTTSRDPLAVALSPDGGITWPQQRDVQHGVSSNLSSRVTEPKSGSGNEFSYPTILQDRNGTDGSTRVMHLSLFTHTQTCVSFDCAHRLWTQPECVYMGLYGTFSLPSKTATH